MEVSVKVNKERKPHAAFCPASSTIIAGRRKTLDVIVGIKILALGDGSYSFGFARDLIFLWQRLLPGCREPSCHRLPPLQLSHGHPPGRCGVTATCKGLIAELASNFTEIPWDIRETCTYGRQMCPVAAAGRMGELWGTWSRHVLSHPAGRWGGGDIPITRTMARRAAGELGPRV